MLKSVSFNNKKKSPGYKSVCIEETPNLRTSKNMPPLRYGKHKAF